MSRPDETMGCLSLSSRGLTLGRTRQSGPEAPVTGSRPAGGRRRWETWLPSCTNRWATTRRLAAAHPPGPATWICWSSCPPIGGATWRYVRYRGAVEADASTAPLSGLTFGPGRALAWEPVIRHVARALAAMEASEHPGADPCHALRVLAEITGPRSASSGGCWARSRRRDEPVDPAVGSGGDELTALRLRSVLLVAVWFSESFFR